MTSLMSVPCLLPRLRVRGSLEASQRGMIPKSAPLSTEKAELEQNLVDSREHTVIEGPRTQIGTLPYLARGMRCCLRVFRFCG